MATSRLWAAVVVLLVGCDATGGATTRIDEAEVEIEAVTAAIADAVGLEVTDEQPLGARVPCELADGGTGAANSLALSGPVPDVDDPTGRSSSVLVDSGYQLVDADLGDGVFGRRDGIRITVVADHPTGRLRIDANTACRRLPAD